MHGSAYTPPHVTAIFAYLRVVGKEWMGPRVDDLYRECLTMGCGTGSLIYCPGTRLTRAEMAPFIDRAFHLYP